MYVQLLKKISVQEDYVVTPLQAIMNSSMIASTITNATGCTDGPYCK